MENCKNNTQGDSKYLKSKIIEMNAFQQISKTKTIDKRKQ